MTKPKTKSTRNNSDLFVVLVDDEEKSLKHFKNFFADKFNIITTQIAEDVIDIIDSRPGKIAIIISDQKMPLIEGIDLLTLIKQKDQDIIRILTTGHASLEDNINAINKSNIFAYLSKPWNVDEVSEIISNALEEFKARKNYLHLSSAITKKIQEPLCEIKKSNSLIQSKILDALQNNKTLSKNDLNNILDLCNNLNSSSKRGEILIDVILDNLNKKQADIQNFESIDIASILNSFLDQSSFSAQEKQYINIDINNTNNFKIKCNIVLFSYLLSNLLRCALGENTTITISTQICRDECNRLHIEASNPDNSSLLDIGDKNDLGFGMEFCHKVVDNFGGKIYFEHGKITLEFPQIDKRKSSNLKKVLYCGPNSFGNKLKDIFKEHFTQSQIEIAKNIQQAKNLIKENYYNSIITQDEELAAYIRKFDIITPIIFIGKTLPKNPAFTTHLATNLEKEKTTRIIAKFSMLELKNPILSEEEITQILKNKNILIADDENVNLILGAQYFKDLSVNMTEVRSGAVALHLFEANNYDLILMDINMPELSGIETVGRIRHIEKKNNLKKTPIIAFSGDGDKAKLQKILKSGFDDYFIKGTRYNLLSDIVAFYTRENTK